MDQRIKNIIRILLICTVLLEASPVAAADISLMKGMYFYNFVRFTTWPQDIDVTKEVDITVFDAQDFSGVLRKISKKSRFLPKMLVKDCRTLVCAGTMQALFLRDITEVKRQYMLERLYGTPVLTISDQAGFLKMGGMIELQEMGGRLVFNINLTALNQSGLYISADILEMAQHVVKESNKP